MEVKFESIIQILMNLQMMEIGKDKDGLPNLYIIKDLTYLKTIFTFYNTEKFLTDDKKLFIGTKCKVFLEEINFGIERGKIKIEEPEGKDPTPFKIVNISSIIADFKHRNLGIDLDHLKDAQKAGIVGEPFIIDADTMKLEVSPERLTKLLPIIRFMDLFQKMNKEKQKK